MRKIVAIILCVILLCNSTIVSGTDYDIPDSVIVSDTPTVEISNMKRIIVEQVCLQDYYGASEVCKMNGYYVLEFDDETIFEDAYQMLVSKYGDKMVYKDQIIDMNNELSDIQLMATSYVYPSSVHGMSGFVEQINNYDGEKDTIRVAIIDSGIDSSASFLEGRLNKDLCKNFILDATHDSTNYADGLGHGTIVSYVIETCTSSNIEIVAYRAFDDSGRTSQAAVMSALLQALEDEVDIVNLSMGDASNSGYWDAQIQALYDAGIVVVASAGNDSNHSADDTNPANLSTTICASALDFNDNDEDGKYDVASYTSYGECVTFSAVGGTFRAVGPAGKNYAVSGTSFSAPLVAAQLANLITFYGDKSVDEHVDIMKKYISSEFDEEYANNPNYHDTKYGYGYLDFSDVDVCDCGSYYCHGLYHEEVYIDGGIEFNGFQISTNVGGIRNIYSVEPEINGQAVMESGLVFGLAEGVTLEEMTVDENSYYVASFAATEEGRMNNVVSHSTGASSYTMTMKQNIGNVTAEGIKATYYVRAYALLEDGTYEYSDIITYSLFDIAKVIYEDRMMANENAHRYLFDNILSVAEYGYQELEYLAGSNLAYIN